MATVINGTTGIDKVQDGTVTADKIASGAVTDAKIAAMAASKLTGQVADSNAPSGSVIQVVNGISSTETSTTGTTLIDTTVTASITPSSTSSKILIIASVPAYKSDGYIDNGIKIALARNGSTIGASYWVAYGLWNYINNRNRGGYSINYLDSPSSTSSLTYKIQIASMYSGYYVGVNHDYSVGSITLMEIAA